MANQPSIKVAGRGGAGQNGEGNLHLPGRSPDEVLGNIADSNLAPGIILATIGTVAMLVALTVGPYFLSHAPEEAAPVEQEKTAATAAPAAKAPEATPATAPSATTPSADAAATAQSTPPISADALKKLDVDEVKNSPNDVNPLEESADDLLKDLK